MYPHSVQENFKIPLAFVEELDFVKSLPNINNARVHDLGIPTTKFTVVLSGGSAGHFCSVGREPNLLNYFWKQFLFIKLKKAVFDAINTRVASTFSNAASLCGRVLCFLRT